MVYREKKERGVTRLTGSPLSAWPINSVYISLDSANPSSILGGTWEALATGRMLVGVDPSDPNMDAAGDVGGEKQVTLAKNQIPNHAHNGGTLATVTAGAHSHPINVTSNGGSAGTVVRGQTMGAAGAATITGPIDGAAGHAHDVSGETGNGLHDGVRGEAHNNMPPYLAVYMWRRTG